MKKPVGHIRFGIVCDSTYVHVWQEEVIKKLKHMLKEAE